MGRYAIVILISGFIALTCGTLGPVSTRAQESTPSAGTTGVEVAPGVTFELMPASEDPPTLYRLRFAPGATLAFVDDPAISPTWNRARSRCSWTLPSAMRGQMARAKTRRLTRRWR